MGVEYFDRVLYLSISYLNWNMQVWCKLKFDHSTLGEVMAMVASPGMSKAAAGEANVGEKGSESI